MLETSGDRGSNGEATSAFLESPRGAMIFYGGVNIRQVTLCYLLNEDEIVLAMKKRGFGEGKLNGYGGKLAPGETITQAVIRELNEESGVTASEDDLDKVGEIDFFFPHKPEWNQTVHVYFLNRWQGEPVETEEMKPFVFSKKELPYDRMWSDDPYWLPHAIDGKHVKGSFVFAEDQSVKEHELETGEPGEIEWADIR